MKGKKNLTDWLKNMIFGKAPDLEEEPKLPPLAAVSTLITRASDQEGDKKAPGENDESVEGKEVNDEKDDKDGKDDNDSKKKGCSFALKRNIVTSLQEIRKFAEENNLAGTMVRAILTLLAEMALGALKGKVSAGVLDTLLKVFNFEAAVADAYNRGVKDGQNAGIEEEFFPNGEDGLPHLHGLINPPQKRPEIFDIAKGL